MLAVIGSRMEFKDYYTTLGVGKAATPEEIKRAYRKLARKYHPDVSKESDAEARFKEVSEAYEALSDPERRAAYDDVSQRHQRGQEFRPPPGWDSGYEFSGGHAGPGDGMDFSDFFETLFGRHAQGARPHGPQQAAGTDHHAKITIDLEDAYGGARRSVSLRVPVVDAQGRVTWQERQLDVNIPKGVREGQHLRLAGQGAAGHGGGPAGDLYLEIAFRPHPPFRVDGRDVFLNLPIAPWEAALGATVTAPTPEGSVQLTIPAGSSSGRKLRLKGKGLPGTPAGDLYAVLVITVPVADSEQAKEAYAALARSFAHFNPRSTLEA
jgi:curved DNA-binding protein